MDQVRISRKQEPVAALSLGILVLERQTKAHMDIILFLIGIAGIK